MDAQQQQYTIFALVAIVVIAVVSFVFLNQKKPKAVKAEVKTSKKSSASVSAGGPAAAAHAAATSDAEGTASGTEAAKKKRKKRSKSKASSKGQVIAPVGQMDDAPESDDEEDAPAAKPEAPPAPKEPPKPKKTMEEKAFEEILKMDDKKNKDKKKDNKKGSGKKSPVVAKMEDSAEAEESDGEDAIFLTGKAAAAADGWAVVEKKGGKQAKKVDASAPAVEPVTASTPSASAEEPEVAPATAPEEEEGGGEEEEAPEEEDKTPASPPVPVIEKVTQELTVEAKRLGLLIGVKGATRIAIQSATDTNIQMPKTEKDSTGDVTISVTGEEAGVAKAITAMKELLSKGYCMLLADPDFRESDATVHPRFLPDIIGKNGSVIKALSQHTGVKITVPTASKAPGPDGKVSKVKIGLAGPKDKVAQCRNLIKEITRYYHTEVTHPNVVHEEMTIDAKYYNFIIGAKGSEIKHIQNSCKVSVHIPDADSVNPNVLIVGEASGVAKAQRHIEKLIEKVDERNNPKPKETTEESEDSGESSSEAQTPTAETAAATAAATAVAQDGEESWMKELGPPPGEAFPATIAAPIGLTKPENGKPAWNTLAAGKTW